MTAFAVAVLACSAFTEQAKADSITGGISLGGNYATNTGNINTATSFTSFSGVFITSVAGSYSSVPTGGSSPTVTQNGFTFNPFSGPVIPLWSFSSGGRMYSFDLTALTQRVQPGDDTLTLRGMGVLHITGSGPSYDDTVGSWVFTANQGGGTFSFSSSNSAIPEGGSALALLGLGLVAVEALRRKLLTA